MGMEQVRDRALQYAKLFISLNAGLLGLIAAFVREPARLPQLRWFLVLGIISLVTSLVFFLMVFSKIVNFDMWEASGRAPAWETLRSKANPLLKWGEWLFYLGLVSLVLFSLVAIFYAKPISQTVPQLDF